MSGLKISSEELEDGIVFLGLRGHLDGHTFKELHATFENHLRSRVYRFVVDLLHLDHMSSAGAGVFISTVTACQDKGGDIALVRPRQQVIDVFEVLGLYQLFLIADDRTRAVEHLLTKRGLAEMQEIQRNQ